jgi:hypothetical protein
MSQYSLRRQGREHEAMRTSIYLARPTELLKMRLKYEAGAAAERALGSSLSPFHRPPEARFCLIESPRLDNDRSSYQQT